LRNFKQNKKQKRNRTFYFANLFRFSCKEKFVPKRFLFSFNYDKLLNII
jgi:hypothetical protein